VWTVAVAFLAAFGATLCAGGLFGVGVMLSAGLPARPADIAALQHRVARFATTPAFLIGGALVSSLAFGLTALAAGRLSPEPLVARLGLGAPRVGAARIALMVLLLLAVGQGLDSILALAGWEGQGVLGHMARALARPSPGVLLAAVLVIGLLAGTGEELFFRGYVQTRLRRRWGVWPAILATSVLFGLVHLDPWHSPVAAVIGVTLGWIAELSGSVRPAIVAHVVNNVLAVVLMALAVAAPFRAHVLILSLALAAVLLCAYRLARPARASR
jgi:hypothetical protein